MSLDLPPTPSGLGYVPWQGRLFRSFARERQHIELVLADSRQEQTVERVRQLFNGRSVDFLFIDADHTYTGIRRDFQLYGPLVRRGGLIAFHDIVPDYFRRQHVCTSSNSGEVPQFWAEVKEMGQYRRDVVEFVEDPKQDGFGIGMLRV